MNSRSRLKKHAPKMNHPTAVQKAPQLGVRLWEQVITSSHERTASFYNMRALPKNARQQRLQTYMQPKMCVLRSQPKHTSGRSKANLHHPHRCIVSAQDATRKHIKYSCTRLSGWESVHHQTTYVRCIGIFHSRDGKLTRSRAISVVSMAMSGRSSSVSVDPGFSTGHV